jgi:isopentenyl-diphosphate delta-isomerase
MTREAQLVELVNPSGHATGTATVDVAHRAPGQLHRAFSVFLVDPAGRVLLQRRAASKTRFAGRWANACCGHPAPGVPVTEAAVARLREELGVEVTDLIPVGVYVYRASDTKSGAVEHEFDHVLVGYVPADIVWSPDPEEVDDLRWASPADVARDLAATPDDYAPWLRGTLEVTERA